MSSPAASAGRPTLRGEPGRPALRASEMGSVTPAQTRGALICSAVTGITAINVVIFTERTLANVLHGAAFSASDRIHLALTAVFLAGTIAGSSALARRFSRPRDH